MSKGKWGIWEWTSAYVLELNGTPEFYPQGYDISLPEMTSSAAILDCIVKISQKKWASREDLGNLVEAFDDILKLQGNYCSWGQESFNGNEDSVRAMLERRFSR